MTWNWTEIPALKDAVAFYQRGARCYAMNGNGTVLTLLYDAEKQKFGIWQTNVVNMEAAHMADTQNKVESITSAEFCYVLEKVHQRLGLI